MHGGFAAFACLANSAAGNLAAGLRDVHFADAETPLFP